MIGIDNTRNSAKQRAWQIKMAYREDLELQIQEKQAARARERLQDMSVNASGWLDPEKSPDRLKPLGGKCWTYQREIRHDRVKPYHTLFLYGRIPDETCHYSLRMPVTGEKLPNIPLADKGHVNVSLPAGIQYQAVTGACAGPYNAMDQVYQLYGAKEILGNSTRGNGSIVQPIYMPNNTDSRPIIVYNREEECKRPQFNPFHRADDSACKELKQLIAIHLMDKDRWRREHDDHQRRLREDLENERRKLNYQEYEAKRRMNDLKRDIEETRRDAERTRKEAERIKRQTDTALLKNVMRPASRKTMLYYDMNDYRLQLIEERKRMEELLKAKPLPSNNDNWDVKVTRNAPPPPGPPTPVAPTKANSDNVREFNDLKHIEQREVNRKVIVVMNTNSCKIPMEDVDSEKSTPTTRRPTTD